MYGPVALSNTEKSKRYRQRLRAYRDAGTAADDVVDIAPIAPDTPLEEVEEALQNALTTVLGQFSQRWGAPPVGSEKWPLFLGIALRRLTDLAAFEAFLGGVPEAAFVELARAGVRKYRDLIKSAEAP